MEIKWTERKYHVQDNAVVELKDLKMYCNTNQFPSLPFCGPHSKPQVASGLSKNYHLRFNPKTRYGSMCNSPYTMCFCCIKSMLETNWIHSIPSDEHDCYKPVTKCTYWPVLGYFNNWNNIQFSHKST